MSTTTVRFTLRVGGTKTDPDATPKLSDPDATYGVKRNDTDDVVVADDTEFDTKVGTGVFTYTFTDPAADLEYTAYVEWVYDGETFRAPLTIDASSTGALVTVARAQRLATLASVDSDYLANLLLAATEVIEQDLHRNLAQETRVEYHDGQGDGILFLDVYPVTSITQVTVIDRDGNETDITGSNFEVDPGTGQLRFAKGYDTSITYHTFPAGFRNIKVTYVGGFPSVPEILQEAVCQTASWLLGEGRRDPAVSSEKLGDWQAAYYKGTGLPPQIRAMIGQYREIL